MGDVLAIGPMNKAACLTTGQLTLAIPSWVGAMSTIERAVTPGGWGVKTGMVRVWVADKRLICKAPYEFICLLFTFLPRCM